MPDNKQQATGQQQFLALLEEHKPDFETLLPEYLDADRFLYNARAVLNIKELYDGQRKLIVTPQSLYQCVLDAARRGLEIGGPNKHCAVVKFKTTAVLIVQWQGMVFLWTKAGAIRKLAAEVVYEGDEFSLERGDEDRIIHRPDLITVRSPQWMNHIGNIIGAYAIAALWSGEKLRKFVSRNDLVRTMEFVKSKNDGKLGFGWADWLSEMAKKTAVRRLEGLIQPPPNVTPEQLDAWKRAAIATESSEVPGAVLDPEDLPPDDLPTDESNISSGKVEVVTDANPNALLTDAQQNEILRKCRAAGLSLGAVALKLDEQFGRDDLAKFKAGEIPAILDALAAGQS